MNPAPLQVEQLAIGFRRREKNRQAISHAVHDISFHLHAGETLALVGESGAGKSLTALSILQLLPYPQAFHPGGSIRYHGTELIGANPATLQRIRGNDIAMIFQEPMSALNPLHTIEKQIAESLALHQGLSGHAARAHVLRLLDRVGIDQPESRLAHYPHQLSGGQRQRVMIAMALANQPDILLADEPTTALDVTVQAKILRLLKQLQAENNLGILLITHDLGMVRKTADRVLIMRHGRLVEQGPVRQVFTQAQQPYTRQLLAAEPGLRAAQPDSRTTILSAERVNVWFAIKRGILQRTRGHIKAVNRVSLRLQAGRTLGIVGESGSGKTTLALALLRLIPSTGRIVFDQQDLNALANDALTALRRQMQIVFQDPYGSLSPRMSVADIIAEGPEAHQLMPDPLERDRQVVDILREVGLDPATRFRYPHEFSGGQRQRICIARALILQPAVILLDEPTSAIDRSVQIQVLELLTRLQQRHHLSYVFISHDLSVVRAMADDLIVMKAGEVIEQGKAADIFADPQTPYTRTLLQAALDLEVADDQPAA